MSYYIWTLWHENAASPCKSTARQGPLCPRVCVRKLVSVFFILTEMQEASQVPNNRVGENWDFSMGIKGTATSKGTGLDLANMCLNKRSPHKRVSMALLLFMQSLKTGKTHLKEPRHGSPGQHACRCPQDLGFWMLLFWLATHSQVSVLYETARSCTDMVCACF